MINLIKTLFKQQPELQQKPQPTMGLLNDQEIEELCYVTEGQPMIWPYSPIQVKHSMQCDDKGNPLHKAISYGQSSFGYDIRLSDKEFYTFKHVPGRIVDPKNFSDDFLELQKFQYDSSLGKYFIIPGNSYALGLTVERFVMPQDVMAICMTKSTYARSGIFANITPLEPGWSGYLTIEIANCSPSDVKVYANEGIGQLLFYRGNKPDVTYDMRQGKYNKQGQQVVMAKV